MFAEQQGLHLSHFARAEDAAQSRDATRTAARLVQSLADELVTAAASPVLYDATGVGANLIARDVGQIGMEAAQQGLADIGMQLRLEQRAGRLLATKNPAIQNPFFPSRFPNPPHPL